MSKPRDPRKLSNPTARPGTPCQIEVALICCLKPCSEASDLPKASALHLSRDGSAADLGFGLGPAKKIREVAQAAISATASHCQKRSSAARVTRNRRWAQEIRVEVDRAVTKFESRWHSHGSCDQMDLIACFS
jgi:hypothetical protein